MRRKRKNKSPHQKLKDKCWELMSKYVRISNSDENGIVECITCGAKKHYKEMFAGHYKHGVLDYNFMNINPQCYTCNNIESGMRDEYYIWLVNRYGKDEVEKLRNMASVAKKGEFYADEYLESLKFYLMDRVDEVKAERNIHDK